MFICVFLRFLTFLYKQTTFCIINRNINNNKDKDILQLRDKEGEELLYICLTLNKIVLDKMQHICKKMLKNMIEMTEYSHSPTNDVNCFCR